MTNGSIDLAVVGASVAAEALITTLRELGDSRNILVVDADALMPYERPPLSKAYLVNAEDTPIDVDWEGRATITRARAVGAHAASKTLMVEDTQTGLIREISYENLVIATGATPIRLPFEPDGVLHLRTQSDSEAIRNAVHPGVRVGIIGAGAIGSELATSLRERGADVHLFDLASGPLERLLSGHLGDTISGWLEQLGVTCHFGANITNISGEPGAWNLHVENLETAPFDVLMSAVGVRPETVWLENSGLLTNGMLQCDANGRVSVDGVPMEGAYGVGDVVTRQHSDGSQSRTESWSAAAEQGMRLAYHLAGEEAPDAELPYFWSDVAGRKIQVLGTVPRNGSVQVTFENPERGAILYQITGSQPDEVGWIGINAQPKIAQLRFA